MFLFVVSSLVAIIVSFLCSLAEAVLLSLNPIRLETLKRQGKSYASVWLNMRQNMGRPIAAILILNTVAHTGGATIAGGAFDDIYGDEWIWLFSVLFTVVILFGTEILPKVLGVSYSEQLAPWIAPILRTAMLVLKPIIWLTEGLSAFFNKGKGHQSRMTIDDIRTLAQIAKTENLIEVEQESIIVNTAKLKDVTVQTIMVPQEWIVYLKINTSIQANFEIAKNNLHTRYPISADDSVDGIIGYVNIKEMATFAPNFSNLAIDQFIRSVLFVSSNTSLLNTLKLFITKHHHLAIIKNPKGKIIGMVTVEDVIEEIVGDMGDELDKSFDHIIQVGEYSWRIGGGIRMETLAPKFALQLEQAAYTQTVAQWLQGKITGTVYPGSSWSEGKIKFVVQQVKRGKIHQIIIEHMIQV